MVLTRRNEMSIYREAKEGLRSLIQQMVPVSLGFLVMLLVTGGKPAAWVIGFSFVSGTLFVVWSEKKRLVAQEKTTSPQNFVNQEQSELITEPEASVVHDNLIRASLSEKYHQFVQDLIVNLQALAIGLERRGYLASCYTAGGQTTSASFMVSLGQNHLIRFLVSDYGIIWTEMRDDQELMKLEGAEAISQLQELEELVRIRASLSEIHHQFVQNLIVNLQALAIVLERRGYLASCYTAGGQMTSASFIVSLGQNHLIRFLVSDYGIIWTEMRDGQELMKLEGAEAISQLQELAELVKFKPKVADDFDELERVFTTISQLSQEVS